MNQLIVYHSGDLDGRCSGAIAALAMPKAEVLGMDYGMEFPWKQVDANTEVVMLDFSLEPPEDMLRLVQTCKLVWIDHHSSANREAERLGYSGIEGIRVNDGEAACELAWRYFFPERKLPLAVHLLGRYDVWDHSEPDVVEFQYGMRAEPNTRPWSGVWRVLLDAEYATQWQREKTIDDIKQRGVVCLQYQKSVDARLCEEYAFATTWEGMKVIALNYEFGNRRTFDSVWKPDRYDAMVGFAMRPDGRWNVSLYSDRADVDVSEVAKRYGGGGHKHAAGFQTDTCPFAGGQQ